MRAIKWVGKQQGEAKQMQSWQRRIKINRDELNLEVFLARLVNHSSWQQLQLGEEQRVFLVVVYMEKLQKHRQTKRFHPSTGVWTACVPREKWHFLWWVPVFVVSRFHSMQYLLTRLCDCTQNTDTSPKVTSAFVLQHCFWLLTTDHQFYQDTNIKKMGKYCIVFRWSTWSFNVLFKSLIMWGCLIGVCDEEQRCDGNNIQGPLTFQRRPPTLWGVSSAGASAAASGKWLQLSMVSRLGIWSMCSWSTASRFSTAFTTNWCKVLTTK